MSIDKLRDIVGEESSRHGADPLRVAKIQSEQNRCIQLADCVAGSVRSIYEFGDPALDILSEKISIARKR
ncbi:MAG: hypothetical protein IKQ93_06720 [Candidatus Methanomethylophilaceae archaeon]|nr:hypothetical protein [Candidatus Methanomethylophilaceae archaeon]